MSQEQDDSADLAEADRQIAEAQQRIVDQNARIQQLERDGQDTANSRELLRLFENTLALMRNRRSVILWERGS
jgi:hypothetical protein